MASFLGVEGEPSPAEIERARLGKRLIWEGLLRACDDGAPRDAAAALVDATYGSRVLPAARKAGVRVAVPVEESGRHEFAFESPTWRESLEAVDPAWAKALIRYNPDGDPDVNDRQRTRLRELSDHCRKTGLGFMLELLVPPTGSQLASVADDRARFDRELRAGLTVGGIAQLREAGIEPDVWKHEGFERRTDHELVAAAARADGRDQVGCIILGRGEDAAAVDRWLRASAGVDGVVGFAIGRTIWWDPLTAYFAGSSEAETVTRIAANYRRFVDVSATAIPNGEPSER
jgi:myo-inositol catabolism protein IolC